MANAAATSSVISFVRAAFVKLRANSGTEKLSFKSSVNGLITRAKEPKPGVVKQKDRDIQPDVDGKVPSSETR